jgi:hypothetical protein
MKLALGAVAVAAAFAGQALADIDPIVIKVYPFNPTCGEGYSV